MPSHYLGRATEDLKRELCALLRDVKDPRVAGKMLSVLKLDLSGDGSVARVFVSAVDGFATAREAVQGLQSAAGFLRGALGRRLALRKTPELRFVADDSIAVGADILRTMDALAQGREFDDAEN